MQVDPALPWDETVDGGRIILASPVSFEDLKNGVLEFTLEDNGNLVSAICNEGSSGFVIKEPTGNRIIYQILRYDGELSELTLIKDESAPSGIWLNDVNLSEVYGNPAFPWSNSVQSAVINVAEPIAWEDIPSKLFFELTIGLPKIQIAENTIDIYSQSSFDLIYQIPKYNGNSDQISINKVGNANTFIKKVHPMNNGIISVPQLPLQGEFTANWQISKEIESGDLVNNSKLPFVVFDGSQYKYYNNSNTSSGNLIYSVSSNAALVINAFSGAVENLTVRGNEAFGTEGFILIGSVLLK